MWVWAINMERVKRKKNFYIGNNIRNCIKQEAFLRSVIFWPILTIVFVTLYGTLYGFPLTSAVIGCRMSSAPLSTNQKPYYKSVLR